MNVGTRRFGLWVPDWPTACLILGSPPGAPAVLVERGRIQHTTVAARQAGVRTGMSTRTAQHLCPELVMSSKDALTEAAHFEEILCACEEEVADISLLRPGLAWGPIAPAARWHGGEEEAAEAIVDAVSRRTGVECLIGIADGTLGALLAARTGQIVPSGQSPAYLQPLLLERIPYLLPGYGQTLAPLISTLNALGITRSHDLLTLDQSSLRARFGRPIEHLIDLVSGADIHLPHGQRQFAELSFSVPIDPPAHHIDHAMIPMTRLAQDIAEDLSARGLNAQSLSITLRTENGQTRTRLWSGCNAQDTRSTIERLRWHAQGWMSLGDLSHEDAPRGPLSAIEATVSDFTTALESDYLWGKDVHREAVDRAITHIQALLGEDAALAVSLQGGHDPRNRTHFRSWGKDDEGSVPREGEWSGGVTQNPDTLCQPPIPVTLSASVALTSLREQLRVIDGCTQGPRRRANTPPLHADVAAGAPKVTTYTRRPPQDPRPREVRITPRGLLSAEPTHITLHASPRTRALLHWEKDHPYRVSVASPLWVIRGRWWDRRDQSQAHRVYMRVATEKTPDLLLMYQKGQWWIEGAYA